MKRLAITITCLNLILPGMTWAGAPSSLTMPEISREKKFSAEWRLHLSGIDYHDEQNQSKIIDLRTEIKTNYKLSDSLSLDIQPTLRLQTGQSQSVDGADSPENKVTLNEASANYRPANYLQFAAGALNQRKMHNRIFIDAIAFPATRAEAKYKSSLIDAGLALESAIPTANSLATNTKELEATPSLNSAKFNLNWTPTQQISLRSSAGYFIFNNLPSAIAQKSRLLGNEINKLSEAQYKFMNEFAGTEFALSSEFPIAHNLTAKLGGEVMQNQKAAADVNSGWLVFAQTKMNLTQNRDFSFEGSYFSIGSESTVSYFNSGGFETNRIGYSLESAVAFKKEAYSIGIKFTDSQLLYSNTFQSRENTILLKLETFYANL